MEQVYEKLKTIREQSGLRQEQVAGYLGVTQTFISKIENGERNLSVDQLERLADLYGCTLHSLVDTDTVPTPIHFAYRAANINQEDLLAIADIGKIAANARFMTELLEAGND